MRILIFIFTSFWALSADFNFEKSVTPEKLKSLDWTTEQSLTKYQKILGKSDFKKDNNYYYEVNKLKYPISIHTKGNKVQKIYFRTLANSPSFDKMSDYLKNNGFKPIQDGQTEYKTFESKSKKIKLKFSAITKNLYSVEKWF